jgi:hypothetical protein
VLLQLCNLNWPLCSQSRAENVKELKPLVLERICMVNVWVADKLWQGSPAEGCIYPQLFTTFKRHHTCIAEADVAVYLRVVLGVTKIPVVGMNVPNVQQHSTLLD